MRRVLQAASRLYPRIWRKRYGAEFEALLEDVQPRWSDLPDLIKGILTMQIKPRSLPVIIAAGVVLSAMAALAVNYAKPTMWRSTATLSFRGLDESRLRDDVSELAQAVLTAKSLREIIASYNLYPEERSRRPIEDVIEQMRRAIQISMLGHDEASLSFIYPDQAIAQRVTQDMARRLIEQNLTRAMEMRGPTRTQVRVVEPPDFPRIPIGPNWWTISLSGLLGGVVFGVFSKWWPSRRRPITV